MTDLKLAKVFGVDFFQLNRHRVRILEIHRVLRLETES